MFFETLPNMSHWDPVMFWWLPLVALVLDILLGDPAKLLHPVQAIGWLARVLEKPARKMGNLVVSGALVLLFLCTLVAIIVGALIWLPFGVGLLFAVYFSWSGLALGCLWRKGRQAVKLLRGGDIEAARMVISHLVTRDVQDLDEEGLCRTLAESLSENLNDGFVAPFLWLLAAGPIGLWLYKTVSTMDSLWGYKTPQWLHLGKAAAKTDDVLSFIPARLTAVFLFISAPLARLPMRWPGWQQVSTQANLMESPNSGWPMAAAAWLHGAAMGGKARYHDVQVDKPLLGPISGHWTVERVEGLVRHILIAGIAAGVIMGLAAFTLSYWL